MNISYELLYSAESVADQTTVTGLLVKDTDSDKTYILVIPSTITVESDQVSGPFDFVEVDASTLEMVNASELFEAKVVDPSLSEQVVLPGTGKLAISSVTVNAVALQDETVNASASEDVLVNAGAGYLGLNSVTVNKVNLVETSVKSASNKNKSVTPTAPAIGFSKVTVEKFDGESGSPESEFENGSEVLIKLPAKFMKLVNRIPEFNDHYKAVISDNNTTYAAAQIVYKDGTYGPRIPMFELIGKVEIIPAN